MTSRTTTVVHFFTINTSDLPHQQDNNIMYLMTLLLLPMYDISILFRYLTKFQ